MEQEPPSADKKLQLRLRAAEIASLACVAALLPMAAERALLAQRLEAQSEEVKAASILFEAHGQSLIAYSKPEMNSARHAQEDLEASLPLLRRSTGALKFAQTANEQLSEAQRELASQDKAAAEKKLWQASQSLRMAMRTSLNDSGLILDSDPARFHLATFLAQDLPLFHYEFTQAMHWEAAHDRGGPEAAHRFQMERAIYDFKQAGREVDQAFEEDPSMRKALATQQGLIEAAEALASSGSKGGEYPVHDGFKRLFASRLSAKSDQFPLLSALLKAHAGNERLAAALFGAAAAIGGFIFGWAAIGANRLKRKKDEELAAAQSNEAKALRRQANALAQLAEASTQISFASDQNATLQAHSAAGDLLALLSGKQADAIGKASHAASEIAADLGRLKNRLVDGSLGRNELGSHLDASIEKALLARGQLSIALKPISAAEELSEDFCHDPKHLVDLLAAAAGAFNLKRQLNAENDGGRAFVVESEPIPLKTAAPLHLIALNCFEILSHYNDNSKAPISARATPDPRDPEYALAAIECGHMAKELDCEMLCRGQEAGQSDAEIHPELAKASYELARLSSRFGCHASPLISSGGACNGIQIRVPIAAPD